MVAGQRVAQCDGLVIPASRARRPTCWRGAGWCGGGAGGASITTRAWCPVATAAPNDQWTADVKGQFRTGLSDLNVWWMRLGIVH